MDNVAGQVKDIWDLMNTTYDREKWKLAMDAAEAAIQLSEKTGQNGGKQNYYLYTNIDSTLDEFEQGVKNYHGAFVDQLWNGEEFIIFDGGRHGYDNLFCDEHDPAQLEHRPLTRYEIPASKLVLELGYSIDYEDEKATFEPDEADTVELINGERMPWEQVKRDGIDYIALYYVNAEEKRVQILDAELA